MPVKKRPPLSQKMLNFDIRVKFDSLVMRKIFYIFLVFLVVSCGVSKKKTSYSTTRKVSVSADKKEAPTIKHTPAPDNKARSKRVKADDIIDSALQYSGVRYKFGGTTKKGMDCSGLLYVSFGENEIQLPRTSYHMAEEGKRVPLNNIAKGDLLFFKTSRGSKRINHVGMVVAIENDEIKFIHASTSRGVIVSSLREGYWNRAFVRANRIL